MPCTGYCQVKLTQAANLHNQGACRGTDSGGASPPNTNIGFHTVVNFASFCDVAPYNFRFHADYGMGGYAGIDGMVDGTSDQFAGDIWGHLMFSDMALENGNHYFEGVGFENCCDGHAELEVHLPSDMTTDPWRTVNSGPTGGLVAPCEAAPPPPPPPAGTADGFTYELRGDSDTSGGRSLTFWQAEDDCLRDGGHLASIGSQAAQDLVDSLVVGTSRHDGGAAWIGFHDRHSESTCAAQRDANAPINAEGFIWTDGSPVTYSNWNAGEPNDWDWGVTCDRSAEGHAYRTAAQSELDTHRGEDCAEFYGASGFWNDRRCDAHQRYVCGFPDVPYGAPDTFKYFPAVVSAAEAEDLCVRDGGHLASAHSDDDAAVFASIAPRTGTSCGSVGGGCWSGGQQTWIGFHDRDNEAGCGAVDRGQGSGNRVGNGEISFTHESTLAARDNGELAGEFVWTDATPSDYENWSAGEPNDWQNGVAKCDGTGNEDCTEVIQNRCGREFIIIDVALEGI